MIGIAWVLLRVKLVLTKWLHTLVVLSNIFNLRVCVSECIRSPGTEVTNGCKSLYGCWEPNSGPLELQPVLFTVEPLLQPLSVCFARGCCRCFSSLLTASLLQGWFSPDNSLFWLFESLSH